MNKKICVYCRKEFTPSHGNRKLCSDECKREYAKIQPSRLAALRHFEPLDCAYCGIEFTPKYPNQKCCCMKHGDWLNKREKKHYTYVCRNCGKTYQTRRKECDQYCSKECAYAYKTQRGEQRAEQEKLQSIERRTKVCPICNKSYLAFMKEQTGCSPECRRQVVLNRLAQSRRGTYIEQNCVCKECGREFVSSFGDKHRSFCSNTCSRRHFKRLREDRKRNNKLGVTESERIVRMIVYRRDGYICGICGEPVMMELEVPEHLAPTLDHIVPLALGGTHIYVNVQCAHFICNTRKGKKL